MIEATQEGLALNQSKENAKADFLPNFSAIIL
jgi:hypothetical protein